MEATRHGEVRCQGQQRAFDEDCPHFYTFCPPECWRITDAAGLTEFTYEDAAANLRQDLRLPADAWNADGVRATDNPMRRMAMSTHGPIRQDSRKVSVIWDWQIADVRAAIKRHACPLPPDYEWFGRSFDGLDYRFSEPLRAATPPRTTPASWTGSPSPNWSCCAMTSPADDPNAGLLAQLKMSSSVSGMKYDDDVLAMLTADPDPDPLDGVE
jgi:hypothetical protein